MLYRWPHSRHSRVRTQMCLSVTLSQKCIVLMHIVRPTLHAGHWNALALAMSARVILFRPATLSLSSWCTDCLRSWFGLGFSIAQDRPCVSVYCHGFDGSFVTIDDDLLSNEWRDRKAGYKPTVDCHVVSHIYLPLFASAICARPIRFRFVRFLTGSWPLLRLQPSMLSPTRQL